MDDAARAERDDLAWLPAEQRDHLQLLSDGIAELTGFDTVAIGIVQHEYDVMVAATGFGPAVHIDDGTPVTVVLGKRIAVEVVEELLSKSEDWGRFKYNRIDQMSDEVRAHAYVTDSAYAAAREPGAWGPEDSLTAPLHDRTGRLCGHVSVDRPRGGRLPDDTQRMLLDKYVGLIERTVQYVLDNQASRERDRLAGAARELVRRVAAHRSLGEVIDEVASDLITNFDLAMLWVWIPEGGEWLRTADGKPVTTPRGDRPRTREMMTTLWERGISVGVVGHDHEIGFEREMADFARPLIALNDWETALMAPLGAGKECLGLMAMARAHGAPVWSPVEIDEIGAISRDLGRVLVTARTFEEEAQLIERLRALDAYKSTLLSTVSHELRTPLSAVRLNLEFAAGDSSVDTVQTSVRAAMRGAERLEAIVGDLLLISALDGDDSRRERVDADFSELARATVADTQALAASHGIACTVDADGPVIVRGEPEQLRRLLTNLVTNAIKYGAHEAVVAVRADGDDAVVTVVDRGPGIAPSDQERLFEEFFRASDPRVRRMQGTGLGLAISRRIARAHGGDIRVTSTLGFGTTFTVRLPLAAGARDDRTPVS